MAMHREVVARAAFMAVREIVGGNPKTARAIIMARGNRTPEEFTLSQVHIPPYTGDVVIDWEDQHGDERVRLDSLEPHHLFRLYHYDATAWEVIGPDPTGGVRVSAYMADGTTPAEMTIEGSRMVHPV